MCVLTVPRLAVRRIGLNMIDGRNSYIEAKFLSDGKSVGLVELYIDMPLMQTN